MVIELPEDAFSPERIHDAYLRCRTGKRGAVNTRGFEANLYAEIMDLSVSLQNGAYRPSRSVCFYVQKPKLREIFAADFRDRIVHRLLVDILEPHYERSFIFDSWACRSGKGTHGAVKRLRGFIRRGTAEARAALYFLQLDIKGFFMSIHKETLIHFLAKRIGSPELLRLCQVIIQHDPTTSFVFKGDAPPPGVLAPHKTLFHADREAGIPIGNLTSQFFANVHLNELDQFVKRRLGVKHYIRYVDDVILLERSPETLLRLRGEIEQFLASRLRLSLKDPLAAPASVYRGIDFLGYFVKPRYTLIRRRVVKSFRKALAESLPPALRTIGPFRETRFFPHEVGWQKAQARLNSYLAHFKHANARGIEKAMMQRIAPFSSMLRFQDGYLRRPRLDRFLRFTQQLRFFQQSFPCSLLLVHTGTFYRLFGNEAASTAQSAGLWKLREYGRGARRRSVYGMPLRRRRMKGRLLAHLDATAVPYVVIRETPVPGESVRVRRPVYWRALTRPVQLMLFPPPAGDAGGQGTTIVKTSRQRANR